MSMSIRINFPLKMDYSKIDLYGEKKCCWEFPKRLPDWLVIWAILQHYNIGGQKGVDKIGQI